MARLEVKVVDRGVVSGIGQVVRGSREAAARYARRSSKDHQLGVRRQLRHVVYDAYTPGEGGGRAYQRNYKLLEAVDTTVLKTDQGADLVIFNNSELVQPTQPKGGSPYWEVPKEIEEGRYPTGWKGITTARPAYHTYVTVLAGRGRIDKITDQFVGDVIRKLFP